MKVSRLEGALLNYWVAKAEGLNAAIYGYACDPTRSVGDQWNGGPYIYGYATDWAQGGPIIEREEIEIVPRANGEQWAAGIGRFVTGGDTVLIAAMRCFVASKFGEDVPDAE